MSLSWSDIQELVVPIRIYLLITWKLLNQGCLMVMLVSSLRKFYGIYVTNDHGYVPLVVSTSRSFCHSWLICGFVTRVTRGVPLVERELLALPEHPNSPPVFSGVDVAGSFVFCVVFCRSSFVIFSLDVVCPSIYGFWLPHWYLHTFLYIYFYVGFLKRMLVACGFLNSSFNYMYICYYDSEFVEESRKQTQKSRILAPNYSSKTLSWTTSF